MEAGFYEKLPEGRKVKCCLCNHYCVIPPGKRGICGVRENSGGLLQSLVYGRVIAVHVDPIEKKPLFHFYPGSRSFSIGTVGCNFSCRFCQNSDIAQMPKDQNGRILGQKVTPEQLVDAAVAQGCRSIAYTYNEPTVFFEMARDTALLAKEKGLANVFVTNGYMSDKALAAAAGFLDAANVDLKAGSDDFYRRLCGARIGPVKENLVAMKEAGIFVEVTTLVIPGENDDERELDAVASFISDSLGTDTPWHVSRFHPTYRLTNRPPTPVSTIHRAVEIGKKAGLKYVYAGNVFGDPTENTTCPACGGTVISRRGYMISENRITDGGCPDCGEPIAGVGL